MRKRNFFLLLAATCSGLSASAQDSPPDARPDTVVQAQAAATALPDGLANGQVQQEPNWANAVAPGEICGTHQQYMAELAAGGQASPEGAGCPPMGPCDDPVIRDEWLFPGTPALTVRLSIHVFCRNSGNDCAATQEDVDVAVARLNTNFAPYGFQFTYETEFIRDQKYRFLDVPNEAGAMKLKYADSPETKLTLTIVSFFAAEAHKSPLSQRP
jgi:hypothetical protein